MNKPVNFELAKLLKEKGFDVPCIQCYAGERLINKKTGGDIFTGVYRLCTKSKFHKRYYLAPTISEVVMWLYEKHNIWIEVVHRTLWGFSIRNVKEGVFELERLECNSPTEAYLEAIEYTLEKII